MACESLRPQGLVFLVLCLSVSLGRGMCPSGAVLSGSRMWALWWLPPEQASRREPRGASPHPLPLPRPGPCSPALLVGNGVFLLFYLCFNCWFPVWFSRQLPRMAGRGSQWPAGCGPQRGQRCIGASLGGGGDN